MNARFPHLEAPLALGPITIRNRIVQLPHGVSFAEPGIRLPTPRHVSYYRRRAAGGVGLICLESSVVSLDGRAQFPLVLSSDPEAVPGYQAIARAVHAEGASVCGQLTHYGNQASSALTRSPLIGPSQSDPLIRESTWAMTTEDMERVRNDFVAAAQTFVAAEFDAIELKLAHDGLLRQFMSPLTNARQDAYGGPTEDRLRFPLEVIEAVRLAVGNRVAAGVRLVVDEHHAGGYDLNEGLRFAELIGRSGLIDFISSDVGITASGNFITPPMGTPEGYAEDAFAGITRVSGVRVIAAGQISTPEYAEKILAEGKADAIGMARQILADPDWALKALGGKRSRIRPCTRCNQLCLGNASHFLATSCTVNPLAGYEEDLPSAPKHSYRVTVVGGGPAGMEAARVAAALGHRVELHEAGRVLGGQLARAARTGGRREWEPYLDWLGRELEELGVTIAHGSRVTADDVEADRVIVACGSSPAHDRPFADAALAIDDLHEDACKGKSVAVVDLGAAGLPFWTFALDAAERGASDVVVVTPLSAVAGEIDGATYLWLRQRMAEAGVLVLLEHATTAVGHGGLIARAAFTGIETRLDADLVVGFSERESNGKMLAETLRRRMPVRRIGDARVPRDAAAAIREGYAAAIELDSW